MATHTKTTIYFTVFVLFASLASLPLRAQTDLGALKGRVLDQRGAGISAATVTLRNPSTSFERTVQTGSSGDFAFVGVPLTGRVHRQA